MHADSPDADGTLEGQRAAKDHAKVLDIDLGAGAGKSYASTVSHAREPTPRGSQDGLLLDNVDGVLLGHEVDPNKNISSHETASPEKKQISSVELPKTAVLDLDLNDWLGSVTDGGTRPKEQPFPVASSPPPVTSTGAGWEPETPCLLGGKDASVGPSLSESLTGIKTVLAGPDPDLDRHILETRCEGAGSPALHALLSRADPDPSPPPLFSWDLDALAPRSTAPPVSEVSNRAESPRVDAHTFHGGIAWEMQEQHRPLDEDENFGNTPLDGLEDVFKTEASEINEDFSIVDAEAGSQPGLTKASESSHMDTSSSSKATQREEGSEHPCPREGSEHPRQRAARDYEAALMQAEAAEQALAGESRCGGGPRRDGESKDTCITGVCIPTAPAS